MSGPNGRNNASSGRARKLAEILASRIEDDIRRAGWPVGHVIGSEQELLSGYLVSRAVLREAVRLLEHHQIATMRRGPGGGLVVSEPDVASVVRSVSIYLDYRRTDAEQLFTARAAVELRVVELATERIDETGIRRLRAVVAEEAALVEAILAGDRPDGDRFDDVVHRVHDLLAELSGNEPLHLFVQVLTKLTPRHAVPAFRAEENLAEVAKALHHAHRSLVEAVIAGDVALARHRMNRHLQAMGPWLH